MVGYLRWPKAMQMYKNMVIMAYGVLACVAIIAMSFDLKNLEMQSENQG